MGRHRVTLSDLKRAMECVGALLAAGDLDQFTDAAARLMPPLLDADVGGYNEADPGRGRFVAKVSPIESMSQPLFEAWIAHAAEHPLVQHVGRHAGDLGVYKITDFVPQHRFRESGLWHEVYHPIRSEYQLAMPLPPPPGGAVAMTFNRSTDFTERDRELLRILQPVVLQAYRNAATMTDLKAGERGLIAAVEQSQSGVLLVGPGGVCVARSATAATLIGRYFADPKRRAGGVPDEVVDWLRHCREAIGTLQPAPPLTLKRGNRRLMLSLVTAAGGPFTLLNLAESAEAVSPLAAAGLTGRESEVLAALCRGRTNKEIAADLSVSARTVEKHIERVLGKLNVRSRTAACAKAMGIATTEPEALVR